MFQIELTQHETEMLREVLAIYLSELRRETARTEARAFRSGLEEREAFVNKLLGSLPAATV